MTNIILLSVTMALTNSFGTGARDTYGSWASNICWVATLRFVTTHAGIYTVDHRYSANGAVLKAPGLMMGDIWSELNTDKININTNFDGRFSCVAGENIIRFPVPPYDHQWFRVKKV